jgi:hypothetical protein
MRVAKTHIRFLVLAFILLLSIPIIVIEWRHYRTYGHLVSYGLHVDVLNRDVSIGMAGRTKDYWAQLFNFTFGLLS